TVHFLITEVNDAPVAVDDTLSAVPEDSGVRTIPLSGLLINDSAGPAEEPSTHVLTVTGVGGPVGGSVIVSGTNVLFTLATHFNGVASFVYKIQDNGGTNGTNDFKTASAAVRFNVTPVNDAPIAHAQSLSVSAGGSVLITLTG